MTRKVQIIYDPDDSCGRLPHNPDQGGGAINGLLNGSQAISKVNESIQNRMKVLQGKKNIIKTLASGRLEVNTDAISKANTHKSNKNQVITDMMSTKRFEILRDKCVKNKTLFVDEEFPANNSSIGNVTGLDLNKIEWLRPKQIDPNADYIQDNIDRFDIKQGQLGNCWLLAVLSSITNYPKLMNHVIPLDQCMKKENYAGIFRFRFWQFGKWINVIIDDRLPVWKGTKQLVFMHSSDPGEFWSPLLEKAYAKLYKGYANLEGGLQAEAMEDFTGGMCETIDLKNPPATLLEDMVRYTGICCMMGCSSAAAGEQREASGLVKGHAYSITGVDYVTYKKEKQWLVRCRNPWGNAVEWKGPFSDNSAEWKSVSQEDKNRLNVSFSNDGEFWMTWQDFTKNWTTIEVCHLGAESLESEEEVGEKKRIEETIFTGEWVKNISAGGCFNNRETFPMNPQFKIVVPEGDGSNFVSIGLMQKDMRSYNKGAYFPIGFMLYSVSENERSILKSDFFRTNKHLEMTKFAACREIVLRKNLKPGHYVIIPSTFEKNQECTFIVRIMTLVPVMNRELDAPTKTIGVTEQIRKEIHAHDHHDDDKVKAHFDKLKDPFGNINAKQLVEILNDSSMKNVKNFGGFTVEIGRSLLALQDNDISGEMHWKEFDALWEDCEVWKYIYEKVDEDGCGHLESSEFREAVNMAGFEISNHVFSAMIHRYSDPDDGSISFADYIICLCRLKNSIENMAYQPKSTAGQLVFTEEEYMQYSIYT